MKLKTAGMFALSLALLNGCATPGSKPEKGPQGTIAYHVEVESSEPGARIEVNNEYIGKTPLTLKIWGDKDGTFHNFGTPDYVIKCYPVGTNQFVQTKTFRTGFWFMPEDRIPSRIYFDLNERSGSFSLDLGPR
ncbi:MAG: PEGA domain-containing protein [Limisphaerales bacterium]